MRNIIIAGNWKMNLLNEQALALINEIANGLSGKTLPTNLKIVCSPVFPYLQQVAGQIPGNLKDFLKIAAQNCSENESGAYTGDVSAAMLKNVGCSYVIIGHSERRQHQKENNELLAKKVSAATGGGLKVIFCCGESLEEREAGIEQKVNQQQIEEGLFHLSESEFKNVVIAYEPVWAIGTGKTATPEQANEIHQFIRATLTSKYNNTIANQTSILYGGSMKPANAADLLAQSDIDGGLIGGASLKSESFLGIVDIALQQL